MSNPILVNSLRGDIVENRHRGAIAVCDPGGKLVFSRGDTAALVYPRSAIKALQALPLVETGAADHFKLSQAELALACSSHGAEPEHTEAVSHWLARLRLDEDSLECGARAPLHEESAKALLRQGVEPSRVHNNCSGKHTGMLTTCQFLSESTSGYIEPGHPAQKRWFDVLGEMADVNMNQLPASRDGCGIPVVAIPLIGIATAFARFAAPDDLVAGRIDAIDRISSAIAANPFMVAGTGQLCTEVMKLTGRRVLIKPGADGVYTAAIPEKSLGIALKIDDGDGVASEVALLQVLMHLGALHADDIEILADRFRVPITNTRNVIVGYRVAADW